MKAKRAYWSVEPKYNTARDTNNAVDWVNVVRVKLPLELVWVPPNVYAPNNCVRTVTVPTGSGNAHSKYPAHTVAIGPNYGSPQNKTFAKGRRGPVCKLRHGYIAVVARSDPKPNVGATAIDSSVNASVWSAAVTAV